MKPMLKSAMTRPVSETGLERTFGSRFFIMSVASLYLRA